MPLRRVCHTEVHDKFLTYSYSLSICFGEDFVTDAVLRKMMYGSIFFATNIFIRRKI